MIPPRNFPPGVLKLVELEAGKIVRTHAELPTSSKNRMRIQQMRNDLLMTNSRLDLQIRENNA